MAWRLAASRAVEDARADERLEARHSKAAPGDAGRHNDRSGCDRLVVTEAHDVPAAAGAAAAVAAAAAAIASAAAGAAAVQADAALGEHHVRAEYPRLLAGPARELVAADAVREAGVVANHRAAARLAAGHGLFQHHGPKALGCGVDRCGETGRPGADDHHIAFVDVVVHAPAGSLDELAGCRLDHRVAVMTNHHRQVRRVEAPEFENAAARRAVGAIEAERNVEAGEHLAQLARAAMIGTSDDAEQVEAGLLVLRPFGQELADHAVEILLEHPWLGDVIVGLPECHCLDDRAVNRVVALYEQDPLGERMHSMRARQEVHACHLAHVVVDNQERNLLLPVGQLAEAREASVG